MNGKELAKILHDRHVYHVYHANSVCTSISFLKLRGIASRGAVERNGLFQTNQISDELDRRHGIWDDTFLDSFDIHASIRDRNKYGPVLFVLRTDFLIELPDNWEVRITRLNPTKWDEDSDKSKNYFNSTDAVKLEMRVGYFDHMITISAKEGIVPFGENLDRIVIDDPTAPGAPKNDFFLKAMESICATSSAAGLSCPVITRQCIPGCKCLESYHERATRIPYFYKLQ